MIRDDEKLCRLSENIEESELKSLNTNSWQCSEPVFNTNWKYLKCLDSKCQLNELKEEWKIQYSLVQHNLTEN